MPARLVITSPPPMRGTTFVLSGERIVIGRGARSDLQVPDSFVSQCHAAVSRRGERTMLEDLGSKNGTLVNGRTVSVPQTLRHGDVIGFGPVEIRFEEAAGDEAWGGTHQYSPVRDSHNPGYGANFTVDRQHADMVNNVGRDQYLQQTIHQRDGFLREIAATRTKARRLIWVGVLLIVVGAGVFVSMVLGFMSKVSGSFSDPESIVNGNLTGPTLGGIPIGLLGWAVSALGMVLVVIGIVLHIVATSRRRQADATFPTHFRGR